MEEIAWKMGRKYVSENTGGGHPTEPRVPTGCPYKERCSRAKGKRSIGGTLVDLPIFLDN